MNKKNKKNKKQKKILLAMSGGIDSSVAAVLLKKQGLDVIGVFYHLWREEGVKANKCCSSASLSCARAVAGSLDMPFYTLDFRKEFKNRVVDYFINAYKIGITPNPCIECNKWIKFSMLMKKARELGCEYIATGHYARTKDGMLYRAADKKKDQSYFLYTLKKSQIPKIIFPVGKYTKNQIRSFAKKFKLKNLNEKKESQDVCFYPEKEYKDFLKRHLRLKKGKIINIEGKILGTHQGIPLYTIGQRKGLGVGGRKTPIFVTAFDKRKNRIIAGEEKDLYKKEFFVKNINWISEDCSSKPWRTMVQVRYRGESAPCILLRMSCGIRVALKKPIRAIASGQSAVFFKRDKVLGGGIISG